MKRDACPIEWLLELLGETTREELWNNFGALASAFEDRESLAVVKRLFRTFTSEWIDSGFAENGSEYPSQRNFAPKWGATVLPGAEADRAPLVERDTFRIPHAVQAMAKCVNGRVQVDAPRGTESKYLVFHDDAGSGFGKPPQMFIEPGGGFSYRRAIELPHSGGTRKAGTSEGQETKDHEEYLAIVAASLFMDFYQSEWRFCLMRCQRCGVFVIPNRKPRKRYEYGWHCENCRSAGTATARMLRVTKQQRQRWLALAAEAWLRWRPKNGERSLWIAEEVNKRLPKNDPRIRRNSVTHNATTIACMTKEVGSPSMTDAFYYPPDPGPSPACR